MIAESQGCGFKSPTYQAFTGWPQASSFPSLCLSFPSCKIGILTVSTSGRLRGFSGWMTAKYYLWRLHVGRGFSPEYSHTPTLPFSEPYRPGSSDPLSPCQCVLCSVWSRRSHGAETLPLPPGNYPSLGSLEASSDWGWGPWACASSSPLCLLGPRHPAPQVLRQGLANGATMPAFTWVCVGGLSLRGEG